MSHTAQRTVARIESAVQKAYHVSQGLTAATASSVKAHEALADLAGYLSTPGALLVALVLPLVAVVALLPERIGPAVGGAGVLLLVVPLALLRLGIGLLASWRAHKGQAWLIPGLGWLSRRWLPEP